MIAHPKIDPVTGELISIGYSARMPYLVYHQVDKQGVLVRSGAYPDTPNRELAQSLGVSLSSVARRARDLNLKKSSAHRSAIQAARMRGKRRSATTREKIRERALGRKMTPDAKAKALATKLANDTLLRGPKHPSWKGGRPWERFKDPQYLAWRSAVLDRDGYICQECGKQCRKYEKGLAAHHIQSYAEYPDLRYGVSNGRTLCRVCHMALHAKSVPEPRLIACACGCGTVIPDRDAYGRLRRFVNRHAKRPGLERDDSQIPCSCGCGVLINAVDKQGRSRLYVRGHGTRVYRREHSVSQETREKIRAARMRESMRQRDRLGRLV